MAFQRDNQSVNVPLVTDILSGDTLLSAGDLTVPTAYGVRAFVGVRRPDAWGYELGYLGVYGMGATRTLTGAESLQLAGALASLVPLPYGAADSVQASYASMFQSAEFNIFKGCCLDACCDGPDSCGNGPSGCNGCCIDWLGGFRYANLNEQAGLAFTCCTLEPNGPFTSSYDVQTSNNLFGGQFDGRAEIIVGSGSGMAPTVLVYDISSAPTVIDRLAVLNSTLRSGVSVSTAKFNTDAIPDIVVAANHRGTSIVDVYDGRVSSAGNARLSRQSAFAALGKPNGAVFAAMADLNRNGVIDDGEVFATQGNGGIEAGIRRLARSGAIQGTLTGSPKGPLRVVASPR